MFKLRNRLEWVVWRCHSIQWKKRVDGRESTSAKNDQSAFRPKTSYKKTRTLTPGLTCWQQPYDSFYYSFSSFVLSSVFSANTVNGVWYATCPGRRTQCRQCFHIKMSVAMDVSVCTKSTMQKLKSIADAMTSISLKCKDSMALRIETKWILMCNGRSFCVLNMTSNGSQRTFAGNHCTNCNEINCKWFLFCDCIRLAALNCNVQSKLVIVITTTVTANVDIDANESNGKPGTPTTSYSYNQVGGRNTSRCRGNY